MLNVERTQIAERLYRQTGFGRYYDSIALGDTTLLPSQTVQVNSGVMGQDSILCTVFNGAVRWFWGDTKRFAYPLGNFESTGATSCIPRTAPSCAPAEIDVSLAYFNRTLDGADFVAPMASIEPVDFPTWIGGLTVVPDSGPLAVDGVAMSQGRLPLRSEVSRYVLTITSSDSSSLMVTSDGCSAWPSVKVSP